MGEQPERLGHGPRGEGVRAEALVEDREGGRVVRVAQVEVELGEVHRLDHRLVHDGPMAEGGDVEAVEASVGGPRLHPLARAVETPLELVGTVPRGTLHQDLLDPRAPPPSPGPQHLLLDRHLAPAAGGEALRGEGLAHHGPRPRGAAPIEGKEQHAHSEVSGGQVGPEHRPGNLGDDPGPVAGAAVGVDSAPVVHPGQGQEGQGQHARLLPAREVGQEADPAGIVLEARVVEPRGRRHGHEYRVGHPYVKYKMPNEAMRS